MYRLAQALSTIQVPATVQAVLGARIDRLPAEEKHLLQTAAVIGNELSLPLLQAIAALPEDVLHRGLAHLQAGRVSLPNQPLSRAGLYFQTRPYPRRGLWGPAARAPAPAARQSRCGH